MKGNAWLLVLVTGLVSRPGLASPPEGQEAESEIVRELAALREEIESLRASYETRLATLESRLTELEKGPAAPAVVPTPPPPQPAAPTTAVPAGAAGAGGPAGALPVYGGVSAGSKVFNPDIAVVGDFLGAVGGNPIDPKPALEMHESEASFQAIVDPYARGDFFFSFGEEGVDLEEGFITFPTLPGGLLAKAGKMRAAFGKVNGMHTHVLPWTDRPLVINGLLGGDEGLSDAGLSVARLIPNPWIFLEATGQVYRGESEIFQSHEASDLNYVARLRGYQDLTESSNLDLGGSYTHGANDSGVGFATDIYGFDATFRYRPLRRAIYKSLIVRSELLWSRRGEPEGRQNAFGFYVSGDYQFARRWFVGLRYDRSDRAADAAATDHGGSFLLTFWPSEFSQIRGQYRRTSYAEGELANEFLFQVLFSIGAHGAHPF